MEIASIIIFFMLSYFWGYSLTFFVKKPKNLFENIFMNIGIGLAVIVMVGFLLNLLSVPLDWKIFLGLSFIGPIISIVKYKPKFKFVIAKSDIYAAIMFVIFLGHFIIMVNGAFNYPYLENDDPYSHAIGTIYVANEKTVSQPDNYGLQYVDPYPPAYDLLFGIIHQTSNDIVWTLKFFNALIISLSIPFFFYFTRLFTKNNNVAIVGSVALASMPGYLSHFIWAIALIMPLFFVAFYCLERISIDKKWVIPAAFVIGAASTMTPTHSIYFVLLTGLYLLTRMIVQRSFLLWEVGSYVLGGVLSLALWWIPAIIKHGFLGLLEGVSYPIHRSTPITAVQGTADRVYSIADFLFPSIGLINNTPGVGWAIALFVVIALFFIGMQFMSKVSDKKYWTIVTLVWFIFAFYAVNATPFPVKLSPFRAWVILAIPVAILAGVGASYAASILKKFGVPKILVLVAICLLMILTVGAFKIEVNTGTWYPGAFWGIGDVESRDNELIGYMGLRDSAGPSARVAGFGNPGAVVGAGFDMCFYCDAELEMQKIFINQSADDINAWMRNNNYDYLLMGAQEARRYGVEPYNKLNQELVSHEGFQAIYQTYGLTIYQVK